MVCRRSRETTLYNSDLYKLLQSVEKRSRVRLSAGSYQDLVNWYCSLLTRRTVCGRAARNTPRTHKQTRNCANSVVALQDHYSYKAPTAKPPYQKKVQKRLSERISVIEKSLMERLQLAEISLEHAHNTISDLTSDLKVVKKELAEIERKPE